MGRVSGSKHLAFLLSLALLLNLAFRQGFLRHASHLLGNAFFFLLSIVLLSHLSNLAIDQLLVQTGQSPSQLIEDRLLALTASLRGHAQGLSPRGSHRCLALAMRSLPLFVELHLDEALSEVTGPA